MGQNAPLPSVNAHAYMYMVCLPANTSANGEILELRLRLEILVTGGYI